MKKKTDKPTPKRAQSKSRKNAPETPQNAPLTRSTVQALPKDTQTPRPMFNLSGKSKDPRREYCNQKAQEWFESMQRRQPREPAFFDSEAEALQVRAEVWRLNGNAIAERANEIERERERLERILSAVEERRNIFARNGKLWIVAFAGYSKPVPDCAGMPYLHSILTQAASAAGNDGGLTPADLCRETHAPPPGMLPDPNTPREYKDEDERGEATEADRNAIDHRDEQTRRKYMNKPEVREYVSRLQKELQGAILDKDAEYIKEIQKELREYGLGDPKQKRTPPNPKKENPRTRVHNAIYRKRWGALDIIEKAHPEAAKHLRETIRTKDYRYTYEGPDFTT
jgi:hypothetical protein